MIDNNRKISISLEQYLEIIFEHIQNGVEIGLTQLANKLSVSKASTHSALHKLLSLELIVDSARFTKIELTSKGKEYAKKVNDKHQTLLKFLLKYLDVSEVLADIEACKIEHIVSDELISKMKEKL